jgi:hypothetical protein
MAVLLNEQKYKNNIRTVSGLVTVTDDDVILSVDTSAGSCSIDLGIIPQKNWSTLYKLYIYDQSGNASANNITLNAAVGQTINGSSSFTINVNGGGVFVRILGLNRYGASATFTTGGGGNGHVIEDEGIALPQQPNLNFIGAGVMAFDDPLNNETVVKIIGGINLITNADLLTLVNTNTVVSGQYYQVTDAIFLTSYFAVQETTPVIVKGISSNSISLEGSGIFLNADYQQVGDYSSVVGFVSNIGVWNSTLAAVVGDVVMWHNKHFVNNTGANTANNPDLDIVNWTVLPKTITNGFIQEIDFVTYDVFNNVILSRKDIRNNYVENNFAETIIRSQTFDVFQWGNNKVAFNKVIENSILECYQNQVIGGNLVNIGDLGIYQNVIQNRSFIALDIAGNTGTIKNNVLSGDNCALQFIGASNGTTKDNFIIDSPCQIRTADAPDEISRNYVFNSTLVVLINNTLSGFIDNTIISSEVRVNDHKGLFNRNTINASVVRINTIDVLGQFQDNSFFKSELKGAGGANCLSIKKNFLRNTVENSTIAVDTFESTSNFTFNDIRQSSTVTIILNNGDFTFNRIYQESSVLIGINNLLFGKGAKGTGNLITGKSDVSIGINNAIISDNSFDKLTSIAVTNANDGNFENVRWRNVSIGCTDKTGSFFNLDCEFGNILVTNITRDYGAGNCFRGQLNTILAVLDLNDLSIYDPLNNTLKIPDDVRQFAGKIRFDNAAGQIIDKIEDLSSEFMSEFLCVSGSVQFNAVSVLPYVVNTIVAPAIGSYTIFGRMPPNLPDSIIVKSSAFRIGIIDTQIFA